MFAASPVVDCSNRCGVFMSIDEQQPGRFSEVTQRGNSAEQDSSRHHRGPGSGAPAAPRARARGQPPPFPAEHVHSGTLPEARGSDRALTPRCLKRCARPGEPTTTLRRAGAQELLLVRANGRSRQSRRRSDPRIHARSASPMPHAGTIPRTPALTRRALRARACFAPGAEVSPRGVGDSRELAMALSSASGEGAAHPGATRFRPRRG